MGSSMIGNLDPQVWKMLGIGLEEEKGSKDNEKAEKDLSAQKGAPLKTEGCEESD